MSPEAGAGKPDPYRLSETEERAAIEYAMANLEYVEGYVPPSVDEVLRRLSEPVHPLSIEAIQKKAAELREAGELDDDVGSGLGADEGDLPDPADWPDDAIGRVLDWLRSDQPEG